MKTKKRRIPTPLSIGHPGGPDGIEQYMPVESVDGNSSYGIVAYVYSPFAAEIVRIVNTRDELVAAAKNLDNAVNEPALGIDVVAASDRLRAVLAKAEGKL